MLLTEVLAVAFSAIRANKLRSALTMLGIVIGVAAVITMVALGSGAQKAVQDQIDQLGTNLLSIYPGQSFFRGRASDQRVSLTTDDATAIERAARAVSDVVPELRSNQQVKFGSQNINVNVMGTTPNYTDVQNYRLAAGKMLTPGDGEARKRVAVVGWAIPDMLGINGYAMIGQTLQIRGISFEVIGLLGEKGSTSSFDNPLTAAAAKP